MEDTTEERVAALEAAMLRVADFEGIVSDIPELLNLRFERIDATLSEHTARFNLLDKQMAMIVRDMRDLRGGVTRQLVEQARLLKDMKAQLDEVVSRLPKP